MKALKFIAIAGFVAIMSVSCQEKQPIEGGGNSQAPAELLSFGFYLEDNAELIDKDYVVSSISEETVIRIPDGGSGKTLIARLEVGENDEAVVNGESPVDGKISVDATYPIDIVVTDSESGLSTAYTIKVGKILGVELTNATVYVETGTTMSDEIDMRINPVDGLPYISYLRKYGEEKDQGSVVKWNGTSFEPVGKLGYTSNSADDAAVYIPMLSFDNNGNIYTACRDLKNEDKELSIYAYSGAWSKLGIVDNPITTLFEPCIFVNPQTNYPVVTYTQNKKPRIMLWSSFDGSAMSSAVPMTDVPAMDGNTGTHARDRYVVIDNAVYLLSAFNSSGYYLYKYENNTWSTIISAFSGANSHYGCISLKADGAGNLYAMLADNSAGGDYMVQLYKIDIEAKTMTPVAGPILSVTASRTAYFDFAINPVDGQIVALYIGYTTTLDDHGIYFGYIEKSTGQWSDFTKIGSYVANDYYPSINYTPDGKGYAAVSTEEGLAFFTIQTEEDVLPE
ncbi:MAG: hypothetical protein IAB91_06025 [Bacteroidetes bacterium]|uniref:Uncharacterized protein n=1 Tax=Candidatus Cryptobacteroides faecigallinarum TaxID=2840763 RepID=A0A9D9NIB1_9BACT|nr:hypothetical protein [Candidatus Cryptobacteroides faecigallinarum]